jgi:uncharacterized protein YegP (UPF0339 family)
MDQYQLYKGNDKQWWWRFITANGEEIFRSTDGYVNRADAVHAINIARKSSGAQCIEQHADGKWYTFTP